MGAQHTAGPWEVSDNGLEIFVDDGRGFPLTIAEVFDGGDMADPAQVDADACLIAAAPDLLAAAIMAEEYIRGFEGDEMQDEIDDKLANLRAAIAKAQGGAA